MKRAVLETHVTIAGLAPIEQKNALLSSLQTEFKDTVADVNLCKSTIRNHKQVQHVFDWF